MPAIRTERLKTQVALLTRKFMRPGEFMTGLRDLFDQYAFHVYRPGQAVPPRSYIPAYHIPELVMLQLQTSLRPECLAHPQEGLALADILWAEKNMEPRLLSTYLLGQIPVEFFDEVTVRLQRWSLPVEDRPLLRALFSAGTVTLRRSAIRRWLEVIQSWLSSPLPGQQASALQALLALLEDPSFENLPAVFSMLGSLFQAAPASMQSDLQDVLEACLRRSPVETGFFLRQQLMASSSTGLTRLARRVLNQLPQSAQADLRELLQARGG